MSDDGSRVAARIRELGLTLPTPPAPAGAYVPVHLRGGEAHVSGQGPLLPGGGFVQGKLGASLTLEQGREASRLAGLSVLATLQAELGTLDRDAGIARVVGYVNVAAGFTATPAVIDG